MSINLLKTGAWAMIGGTTCAALSTHIYNQWHRETREADQPFHYHVPMNKDTLLMFAIGAVAGSAFRLLAIPGIQFLAKGTLKMGRAVYDHREDLYNGSKWLFTK